MPIAGNKKSKLKEILQNTKSFGTSILAIFLDEFGTDLFQWEPETIRREAFDNYSATLPQVNQDKLWGLITAITTNQFYVSLEIFMATCSALSDDEPDFGVWTPSAPEELAWGVSEVLLNDPFDNEHPNQEFSNEIEYYVGLILKQNGILEPPKILSFAEYSSTNPVLDLDTAFVDDPAMFEAAWANQQNRKFDIEAFLVDRTQSLIQELASIPFENANKQFINQLRQSVTKQEQAVASVAAP